MKKVYAIIDTKADELGPLMTFRHEAAAIRAFTDLARSEKTAIAQHPEDYALLCLGTVREEANDKLNQEAHTLDGYVRAITVITGSQWLAANTKPTQEDANNAS